MTPADRGLMFKKDFARLIDVLQHECTVEQLQVFMGLLAGLNSLPDNTVGEVLMEIETPEGWEGLI